MMKKGVAKLFLMLIVGLAFVSPQISNAQDGADSSVNEQTVNTLVVQEEPSLEVPENDAPGFTEKVKSYFIEGKIEFMIWVLLCLIIGVAIAIERIIYLSLATVNTNKLLQDVDAALTSGGIDAAKEVCRNTRGPVGSIFYEGLSRSEEGAEAVERAIISGGSVQMGLMEKGTSWISLFIALAPMLGFLGTVIGMIDSFSAIEEAGGIKPTVVAGGIKTALITTVAGLIVAIILQVFFNFIVSKIDNLVNSMEDASNSFVKMVKTKIS